MDKENLAYKLTTDVLKHYKLEELENHYNLKGAKLIVAIYNEIAAELNVSSDNVPPVLFTGEDSLLD